MQPESLERKNPVLERPYYPDDEIDLMELFQNIWDHKWVIAGLTFLLTLLVTFYSLTLPNQFKAQASLVPVSSGGGGIGLGQYAGLASLAGVSLPRGEASKSQEALAVLQSYAFLSDFIEQRNLKPRLFADNWDGEGQSWVVKEPTILEKFKMRLVSNGDSKRSASLLAPGEPSMLRTVERLRGMLAVGDNRNNSLVTVSIEHTDPVFAAELVNELVRAINEHMRQQEMESAQRSIAFLERQVNQINLVEHRQVAFRIIEENLKNLTLAQTETDFVFRNIDPAVVPEQKSGPKRSLMVAVALVLGMMLGIFYALVRSAIVKRREQASESS